METKQQPKLIEGVIFAIVVCLKKDFSLKKKLLMPPVTNENPFFYMQDSPSIRSQDLRESKTKPPPTTKLNEPVSICFDLKS